MTKLEKRSTVRIIDLETGHLIQSYQLMKGQTYTIPKGYDIVQRRMSDSLETCYVRKISK